MLDNKIEIDFKSPNLIKNMAAQVTHRPQLNIRIHNPYVGHPEQWTGPEKRIAVDLIDSWLRDSLNQPIRFRENSTEIMSEGVLVDFLQKECTYHDDYVAWILRPKPLVIEKFLKDHYQKNKPTPSWWQRLQVQWGLIKENDTEQAYLEKHIFSFSVWILQSAHLRTELVKVQSNLKGLLEHWHHHPHLFTPKEPPPNN